MEKPDDDEWVEKLRKTISFVAEGGWQEEEVPGKILNISSDDPRAKFSKDGRIARFRAMAGSTIFVQYFSAR